MLQSCGLAERLSLDVLPEAVMSDYLRDRAKVGGKALAAGPVKEPYTSEFAKSVGLATATSLRRALEALVGEELVTQRQGLYRVFDPFFAAWLTQTL
jgi:hypothetical protein